MRVVLDPMRARALGQASITGQGVELLSGDIQTSGDGLEVNVVVVDVLELGLLGLLVDQTEPLTIRARPRRPSGALP